MAEDRHGRLTGICMCLHPELQWSRVMNIRGQWKDTILRRTDQTKNLAHEASYVYARLRSDVLALSSCYAYVPKMNLLKMGESKQETPKKKAMREPLDT